MQAPGTPIPNSDGQSPSTPGNRSTVILHDQITARWRVVSRVVESCGALTAQLDEISTVDEALDLAPRATLALIALGRESDQEHRALASVRALTRRNVSVICYARSTDTWPLGAQCRPLLAGAWKLLDSDGPDFVAELRRLVDFHFKKETARVEENSRLQYHMQRLGIVGESPSLLSIFRWVKRVSALSDLPTLISGETGTGKELIARAIHRLDPKRHRGPFVALNCGAISPGLIESELFGHRRGAFTGAERERKGLIRSAQSGVLFLDEIGELDLGAQTKLLRVLQENRVLGLGDDRETAVDIRVIAATNRRLNQMVEVGKFRLDLYHRLNVLSVNIPPLRERLEDLRPLIGHFVSRFEPLNPTMNRAVKSEFIEALSRVELPGNARQLENLVRRALIEKDDSGPLDLSDLPAEIWEQLAERAPGSPAASHAAQPLTEDRDEAREPNLAFELGQLAATRGWDLPRSLEYCEKWLLESALQRTNGSQSATARLLGITPRSVYNKLRKHSLRPR